MQHRWIEAFEGARLQELHDMYSDEWWTRDRQLGEMARMLEHSDIVIGCCDGQDRLVGFARVLTDFTFKAVIFDVIVHDDFRGRGVGRAIVERIIGHEALGGIRNVELYCPDRLVPFYEKLGFSKGSSNLLFRERQPALA